MKIIKKINNQINLFIAKFIFSLIFIFGMNFSYASTVILSLDQITQFQQIHLSNYQGFSYPTEMDENGVVFLTYFVMQDGQVSADVGQSNAGYDWSSFQEYNQSIYNFDDNSWNFSISVKDNSGYIINSETIQITPDENHVFTLDLLALPAREFIDEVWVTVSGNIPLPGNDAVSEWELSFGLGSAAEVPLPPASFLYIAAISGFILARRSNI